MSISIAILAPSPVPFQIGGAEKFWMGLQRGLMACSGHFVELIKLPSREDTFEQILDSYQMFSELDLAHFDMVITTKYPAWMVRHFNHVIYLQHPLRVLYDTYHFSGLPETLKQPPAPLRQLLRFTRIEKPSISDTLAVFELARKALAVKSLPSSLFAFPGPLIRELVHFFDRAAMSPTRVATYFTISETVKNRKDYLPPGVNATVLHHPSDITTFLEGKGSYIFTASRLNSLKRLNLVVKAMAYVKSDVPLKIAGTGPDLETLKRMAESDRRIEFLGHVADPDLPALYSGAICVPFVPYDEDYGLITIEAMMSGKPVITCNDSGGVLEFVENGNTGFHVAPEPAAIGAAIEKLVSDSALAARMGAEARRRVESISWQKTTSAIFFHNAVGLAAHSSQRRRVVVCAPFRANRHGFGGQRRLYHICAEIAREFDVTLVCPAERGVRVAEARRVARGFNELAIPWMESALDNAENPRGIDGEKADGLALLRHCATYGHILDAIEAEATGAACVIASQHWLFPAIVKAAPRIPLVYDAHNVEADIMAWQFANKYPDLLKAAIAAEKDCCQKAAFILARSSQDMRRLAELYNVNNNKFILASNGYDADELKFTDYAKRRKFRYDLPFPRAKLVLFIGSAHKSNREAVEHIMAMAPLLPKAQFMIGGTVSVQPEILALNKPDNVHLLGLLSEPVKNLLLAAIDASINPISSGPGANFKIMEYIPAGAPCISTPLGCRGLEGDFSHALLIREIGQFPDALRKILKNPPDAAELAKDCRAFAARYSWRETMKDVAPAIQCLIHETA